MGFLTIMSDLSVKIQKVHIFWRPRGEKPEEMADICKPAGKDVIHIAGYGGFAEWLLYKGSKSVASVDYYPDPVNANRIQKAIFENFNFLIAHLLMINREMYAGEYRQWLKKLHEQTRLSVDYLDRYFTYIQDYFNSGGGHYETMTPFSLQDCFPYIDNQEAFDKIEIAIKNGKWKKIVQSEFVDFLKEQEESSADIIYASSVRNWMLDSYLDEHYGNVGPELSFVGKPISQRTDFPLEVMERFEKEFDNPLAKAAYRCLRNGGAFIEVEPLFRAEFPNYPIPFHSYWGRFDDASDSNSCFRKAIVKK